MVSSTEAECYEPLTPQWMVDEAIEELRHRYGVDPSDAGSYDDGLLRELQVTSQMLDEALDHIEALYDYIAELPTEEVPRDLHRPA